MGRGAWFAVGLGICLMAGCGQSEPDRQEAQRVLQSQAAVLEKELDLAADSSPDLVFRLAFSPDVDLDIYVTDPMLETIYFANHRAKTGGQITADARCDSEFPDRTRVEEVRFPAPYPGRYRLGVDFPERCNSGRDPAAFAASVVGRGVHQSRHGTIAFQQFEVVVLEFDYTGEVIPAVQAQVRRVEESQVTKEN